MFSVHLMPRADNAALQKREGRLNCVRVNVTMGILSSVIDRFVFLFLYLVEGVRIDSRFVGKNDFHRSADVCGNDLGDYSGLGRFRMDQAKIPVAFPDADDYVLDRTRTPASGFAPDVGFI